MIRGTAHPNLLKPPGDDSFAGQGPISPEKRSRVRRMDPRNREARELRPDVEAACCNRLVASLRFASSATGGGPSLVVVPTVDPQSRVFMKPGLALSAVARRSRSPRKAWMRVSTRRVVEYRFARQGGSALAAAEQSDAYATARSTGLVRGV
jgi:hypothetical protein